MPDDQFIADAIRRINTVARKHSKEWQNYFSGFFERYLAATAERRDWEARLKAHVQRVRDEPQLRWAQRPPEADNGWRPIYYADPLTRYLVCRWPGNPKTIVVDGHAPASAYPKVIEPYEYHIFWDAYGWTPPGLFPEEKPVVPVMLLHEDARYQDIALDGVVFGLTCFHDTYGPRRSASIRPINPWGFGIGSDRGFTNDKEDDIRSLIFLMMMRRAEGLEGWHSERIEEAIECVEHEFLEPANPDKIEPQRVRRKQYGSTEELTEWSGPMTLAEMARRLTGNPGARARDVRPLLDRFGLDHVDGRKYRVRIDKMDTATRRKIEQNR